jgi:hypothetical protein
MAALTLSSSIAALLALGVTLGVAHCQSSPGPTAQPDGGQTTPEPDAAADCSGTNGTLPASGTFTSPSFDMTITALPVFMQLPAIPGGNWTLVATPLTDSYFTVTSPPGATGPTLSFRLDVIATSVAPGSYSFTSTPALSGDILVAANPGSGTASYTNTNVPVATLTLTLTSTGPETPDGYYTCAHGSLVGTLDTTSDAAPSAGTLDLTF